MTINKIHTLALTLTLLFLSCEKEQSITQSVPAPDTTPQTTLMYMTGTDLSYYFNQNITAAKTAIAAQSLGYGRFLLFKHDTSSSGNLIEYKYENGACVADTLKTYSSIVSLTEDAIVEVIADLKELAPADSYNLIVSGHATGWVKKDQTTSSWKSAPASAPVDWGLMNSSPVVTRYLGSDNDSYFDIEELQQSLALTNTHFGYILFDECFMSSIEALYDLRNLCNYIVASPCEIMGNGFPYDYVIPKLFSDYGTSFDLQGVCEVFVDYYSTYSFPSGCVALTVTSELDALASIVKEINSSPYINEVDTDQIQAYERLTNHIFFDLEDYMLAKCADSDLAARFLAQMELAFPSECRLHTDRFFANTGASASSANSYDAYFTTIEYYSGITTSQPSTQSTTMTSQWEATAWAQATN